MIAQPFRRYDIFGDLIFTGNKESLEQYVLNDPKSVEYMLWNKPWFYIDPSDFDVLQTTNRDFTFQRSTIALNKVKNEMFDCFVIGPKKHIYPNENDWSYFKFFYNKFQNFQNLKPSPQDFDIPLSWIVKDADASNDRICNVFQDDPETINNMLIFNETFCFDQLNLTKIATYNTKYSFSQRAILWNELKIELFNDWRKHDVEESRLNWELKKSLEDRDRWA